MDNEHMKNQTAHIDSWLSDSIQAESQLVIIKHLDSKTEGVTHSDSAAVKPKKPRNPFKSAFWGFTRKQSTDYYEQEIGEEKIKPPVGVKPQEKFTASAGNRKASQSFFESVSSKLSPKKTSPRKMDTQKSVEDVDKGRRNSESSRKWSVTSGPISPRGSVSGDNVFDRLYSGNTKAAELKVYDPSGKRPQTPKSSKHTPGTTPSKGRSRSNSQDWLDDGTFERSKADRRSMRENRHKPWLQQGSKQGTPSMGESSPATSSTPKSKSTPGTSRSSSKEDLVDRKSRSQGVKRPTTPTAGVKRPTTPTAKASVKVDKRATTPTPRMNIKLEHPKHTARTLVDDKPDTAGKDKASKPKARSQHISATQAMHGGVTSETVNDALEPHSHKQQQATVDSHPFIDRDPAHIDRSKPTPLTNTGTAVQPDRLKPTPVTNTPVHSFETEDKRQSDTFVSSPEMNGLASYGDPYSDAYPSLKLVRTAPVQAVLETDIDDLTQYSDVHRDALPTSPSAEYYEEDIMPPPVDYTAVLQHIKKANPSRTQMEELVEAKVAELRQKYHVPVSDEPSLLDEIDRKIENTLSHRRLPRLPEQSLHPLAPLQSQNAPVHVVEHPPLVSARSGLDAQLMSGSDSNFSYTAPNTNSTSSYARAARYIRPRKTHVPDTSTMTSGTTVVSSIHASHQPALQLHLEQQPTSFTDRLQQRMQYLEHLRTKYRTGSETTQDCGPLRSPLSDSTAGHSSTSHFEFIHPEPYNEYRGMSGTSSMSGESEDRVLHNTFTQSTHVQSSVDSSSENARVSKYMRPKRTRGSESTAPRGVSAVKVAPHSQVSQEPRKFLSTGEQQVRLASGYRPKFMDVDIFGGLGDNADANNANSISKPVDKYSGGPVDYSDQSVMYIDDDVQDDIKQTNGEHPVDAGEWIVPDDTPFVRSSLSRQSSSSSDVGRRINQKFARHQFLDDDELDDEAASQNLAQDVQELAKEIQSMTTSVEIKTGSAIEIKSGSVINNGALSSEERKQSDGIDQNTVSTGITSPDESLHEASRKSRPIESNVRKSSPSPQQKICNKPPLKQDSPREASKQKNARDPSSREMAPKKLSPRTPSPKNSTSQPVSPRENGASQTDHLKSGATPLKVPKSEELVLNSRKSSLGPSPKPAEINTLKTMATTTDNNANGEFVKRHGSTIFDSREAKKPPPPKPKPKKPKVDNSVVKGKPMVGVIKDNGDDGGINSLEQLKGSKRGNIKNLINQFSTK